MFDAKSILESLVTGGQRGGASVSGKQGDPLSDLLGGSSGGLGDLLRNMVPSKEDGGASSPQGDPLSDLLGKLGGGQSSQGGSGGGSGGSSIVDVLGNILKQATDGTREGAHKLDQATGASDAVGDLSRQLSGKSPEELMKALQDLIANNKLGAGTALGGLGALILGTETGRSAAMTAAKLGALALIGGLAYKAYQNYKEGNSAVASASGALQAPPSGSGFEVDAMTNDDAILMLRAMIAASAADGRIDGTEQQRILEGLKQGGGELGPEAEEFLAGELNAPASPEALAAAVGSREQAASVYSAARIAVDPDTRGEQLFLNELARRLGIDQDLARHIDAAARNA